LKNGPVVRKCFNVARPSQGGARPPQPLASLRGLVGQSAAEKHPDDVPLGAPSQEIFSLRLGSCLPINLREFLLAEFGGGLRIEDDVIYFMRPRAGDLFVRELARAIRRFSYIRAQEHWIEYAVERSRLEAEFGRQPAANNAVAICLECECFGAGALAEHQGERCITLVLTAAQRDSQKDSSTDGGGVIGGRGLYPVIEEFRQSRQTAGLSHFGLDYYVANDHIVFTWQKSARSKLFRIV
jgi:hypothetical protein